MPKKKSIKKCSVKFCSQADSILQFLDAELPGASKDHASWMHEYAIIRLYRIFERMVLETLVGAVNNDTSTLSANAGIKFPKHLTDEVCEYLLTGGDFFDFRGRDGLIKEIKSVVPDGHFLVGIVKNTKYKQSLEQLSAVRNYAAHDSAVSKARFKKVIDAKRVPTAGAWLKRQNRFKNMVDKLKDLAADIETAAPF